MVAAAAVGSRRGGPAAHPDRLRLWSGSLARADSAGGPGTAPPPPGGCPRVSPGLLNTVFGPDRVVERRDPRSAPILGAWNAPTGVRGDPRCGQEPARCVRNSPRRTQRQAKWHRSPLSVTGGMLGKLVPGEWAGGTRPGLGGGMRAGPGMRAGRPGSGRGEGCPGPGPGSGAGRGMPGTLAGRGCPRPWPGEEARPRGPAGRGEPGRHAPRAGVRRRAPVGTGVGCDAPRSTPLGAIPRSCDNPERARGPADSNGRGPRGQTRPADRAQRQKESVPHDS